VLGRVSSVWPLQPSELSWWGEGWDSYQHTALPAQLQHDTPELGAGTDFEPVPTDVDPRFHEYVLTAIAQRYAGVCFRRLSFGGPSSTSFVSVASGLKASVATSTRAAAYIQKRDREGEGKPTSNIVAFRQSTRRMTHFNINVVSDTVCP